jgi:SpoVK/Ycf46/Vps4 family AAA+-type ATPase
MADIGIDLTLVEEKLDRLFQLASSWEAVLLFDEADILLEARATEDNITRNSIVSSALSQGPLL